MRRRDFITLLGGATAWPLVARAQLPMPVVGWVSVGSSDASAPFVAGFQKGLSQTGYVEGQNVAVEYRWADNQFDRMPAILTDLVGHRVSVLVTSQAALAKAVTKTIPIVALFAADPVKSGFVASYNQPGGNVTGVTQLAFTLGPKRLEFLNELVPRPRVIAVLHNPDFPNDEAKADLAAVEDAARTAGQQIHIVGAGSRGELESAFATVVQRQAGALLVMANPFFNSWREQIVGLAARHAIPSIYEWRQFTELGGLMSYGSSLTDTQWQLGIYAGKILQGAKPSDLPVMLPVKVELVLNLKTAKTQGVTFPITLLGRADEVIE
jgi:putative tryptophan/tyrosine transport system substrate-binding protein